MENVFCVSKTDVYEKWFLNLKDKHAKIRINLRIRRLELGNFGDFKPVGDGVCELRIDCGAGYRIYFRQEGCSIVLLLCGGDKDSQDKDIKKAKAILKEIGG